jgi:hypothetical protein
MPKKNRLSVDFKGFAEVAENLDRLGGDLKEVTDKALEESRKLVDSQLHSKMLKHHRSGDTERSILDHARVTWSGWISEVEVGFDISNGGLPSIFLMYGTPRMDKDQDLYNAVYGSGTKRKINELQKKVFDDAIKKRMGG